MFGLEVDISVKYWGELCIVHFLVYKIFVLKIAILGEEYFIFSSFRMLQYFHMFKSSYGRIARTQIASYCFARHVICSLKSMERT